MPPKSEACQPARPFAGLARWFLLLWLAVLTDTARATLLWSDLGATQVHETGAGDDILGGVLRRDDAAADTLYFKFHVDPLSDATTEEYFAAFQLFEGHQERLAVGNALKAWAYSAFVIDASGSSNQVSEYIDLNSSQPEPSGVGTFYHYELPHWGIERTIVFKVQYVPGGDDLVTVWLDPDLRPGATEASQSESRTTHFKANASFDQIHLRHGGGGAGWIFSEMAIATSFDDFVNGNGPLAGQNAAAIGRGEVPFTFRSWQREQGLPENYVRTVAQTSDGYIWVGTDDGVSRFDGVRFFSLGLPEGFHSGPVQVLYGDSRGALWIGGVGGGLGCWQNGKLRTFTARDGLPSDSITSLAEDRDGRLWVGTMTGLALWQRGHLIPFPAAEIFAGKTITAICRDQHGVMWVGAAGLGIFSCDGRHFTPLHDPAQDQLLLDSHCLLVDHKDRLWIGAGDAFVLCREGDSWRRFGMPRHLATHYISALAEGPDGTVWAGSVGEGLIQFEGGKLVAINANSGLSDNLVEALHVDHEGRLWVGTHGGLNRLSPRNVSVLGHNEGLGYGEVQGLAEVRPGIIWAEEPNEGLFAWDGRYFRRLMLGGLGTSPFRVSSLLAARDGSCWVAAANGLLHYTNPMVAEQDGSPPVLTNLSFSALTQDSQGTIWAGALDGQLWSFTHDAWLYCTNVARGHAVTAIASTADGTLWLGTDGEGLYQREPDGICRKIPGLPTAWIRALHLDATGTLWIGTAGGGLCRSQNGRLSTFTMREGLPDNTISQIVEDDHGSLWLGGNLGITRIKKSDLDDLAAHKISAVYPQVYGRADGMASEECSGGFSPVGLRTASGLLWFPTLKGIAVIDPRQSTATPAPAVVLEQTLVDGVTRPVGGSNDKPQSSPLSSAEVSSGSLDLGPGKHSVEFRYTGLSYDAPERVRFRYRLEGLDADWVEAGTRRTAFYSFVPPGHYRFQVIACNGDGIWNMSGAVLQLTVARHFWQSGWFLGVMGLIAVITAAGVARLVEQRRLREHLKALEQARALERERTRIAQDLHDIMGAKLCRISFLSEHARRSETVPADLREEIRSISDDSREVLRSLDEMVWAVNPQKDSLDHVVSYIGQYAQEYFKRTGIQCELQIPAHVPARPLSSQSRHHLFLAVHEALTNILKHSGADRARVSMDCRNSHFEVTISDNGQGFDPQVGESAVSGSAAGFRNGLGNMRHRLDALGGRCAIESIQGQGTTVRFWLSFSPPLN